MTSCILITGGAGFIGSHLVDLLLADGHRVRVLDNLNPQVHPGRRRPSYLSREAELIVGDVRDSEVVSRCLRGIDQVVHLAAAVGVGQSMYEIADYIDVNEMGTAVLLEALAERPVERLVVASSMSIYGEGLAHKSDGTFLMPEERTPEQLRRGEWELLDERGRPLAPLPTPETKRPTLSSVYALNKYAQERLCLMGGRAYAIPAIALRFFNVYGTRQALSNPYTGVLAIFASRLLNDRAPLIFEDGRQQRDFVHVSDVVKACKLALEAERGIGEAYNIGSGQSRTILSVARDLAAVLDKEHIVPRVTGKYRAGDVRHCFADIRKAKRLLGFSPQTSFTDGLGELADWLAGQIAEDHVERATSELEMRGLVA